MDMQKGISEREDRLEKLKKIKDKGVNPYPAKTNRTHRIEDVLCCFDTLEKKGWEVVVVGRLMAKRGHGGLVFGALQDGNGKIQLAFSKDEIGEESHKDFLKLIDTADFLEISGTCFHTQKGEPTIKVKSWRLLSKALLPLPEKWHGLKDVEERLRKRYLDILINPEVKDMFFKKAKFWEATRKFLKQKGFLEVETPVLEVTAGGADAQPFKTHHNALDMDVYLRISMGELWQKKLMVAGLEKTYEIGRQFRNEGMDADHLQDYTQMEFYWAYANYEDGMALTEEMYKYIVQETIGTLKFETRGHRIDLRKKWERYDFNETVKKYTGIDIDTATEEEMRKKLEELNIEYEKKGFNITRAMDNLWKYCRRQISGPGFLVGTPVTISPLAKRDEARPRTAQKFQPIIAGSEVGNGYSELNDPVDQRKRFEEQQKLRDAGDDEAQMYDGSFVEALEHGMPPVCGFGMSERFFSFMMDKPMRETQIFPLMKPRDYGKAKTENESSTKNLDLFKVYENKNLDSKGMSFEVDDNIFEKFPDLVIGGLILSGVDNRGNVEEVGKLIREKESILVSKFRSESLSEHPKILSWRDAYKKFGVKPKQYTSSIENLIKRIVEGEKIGHINKLVDIYNYISLKYMVPAGGEDLDKIKGNISLAIAKENESPVLLLGEKEEKSPKVGEVIYKDDISAICRRFNWKEATRTKLTEDTKDAVLVVEGLSPVGGEDIKTILGELAGLVEKNCGGKIRAFVLDKSNQKIEF